MSGKKKSSKAKKSGIILRCIDIKFEKKPKKDRKGATLIITYETSSGSWQQKKVFEDVWKFAESTGKSHKKIIGKYIVNASKYKDEYLNKSKPENAFKMIKDVINNCGKSKKILSTDSKITAFIGAKRDNLNDIKTSQKITSTTTTSKVSSIGGATFMSDLGGGGGGGDHDEEKKEEEKDPEQSEQDQQQQQQQQAQGVEDKEELIRLQQELETLKRKHLADISALKQENHNLKINNETLRETNDASQEARAELEEKIIKYEHELGRDQIGDEMASIFAEEFKKVEDPAEKYYQQTKEQRKRIVELEEQVSSLTHLNGDLTTKLERAKYVADHLALEVTELRNPKYEELEQDYKEVEAELDEVTQVKERYEIEMAQTAKVLDELELECAKMRPHYQEYPNLVKTIEQQRNDSNKLQEKLNKLQEERDDFEDKYLEIKKRDVIPMEQHKSTIKSYKQQIQSLNEEKAKYQQEKQEAIDKMEGIKQEMAEIKIKLGQLEADNHKLEKGGGRDINLEIELDLENDFSIFKRDEFEYPHNLSRDELILWCEHFKLLIREINDELCSEINILSKRNQTLETYIELNNLPFPEDNVNINTQLNIQSNLIKNANDLPHPLPSMNYIEDLDSFNPTKQQLKDYIDLMFNEWRRDENDLNYMLLKGNQDQLLLNELLEPSQQQQQQQSDDDDNNKNDGKDNPQIDKLKKQLEAAYLKQEEKELEFNKKVGELTESIEQLQKQLRTEQQKNKKPKDPSEMQGSLLLNNNNSNKDNEEEQEINDHDHDDEELGEESVVNVEKQQLLNRLNDTEQYIKDLQDDMKQLEFETSQQKQALEREYKYQIELINIDLEESRNQCDDLQRQIGSDDLNLLASEFRNEVWDARNDNNELKKKHIEEIRQLERDRDELLREINLLRIKTDRMDQNTDEAVAKIQIELDKKDKELQHFIQVTSNLSNVRDQMDTIQAHSDQLEESYQSLKENSENEKNLLKQEIQQLNIQKKNLLIRIDTAEQDIKSLKQGAGIDSNTIITKTELVKMTQEMDDLRIKRAEAIKSKIKLLQTSSLEIERMRDEIKLLTGHRKISMRDFKPGRYDSTLHNRLHSIASNSSLGSQVPYNDDSIHQMVLHQDANDNDNKSYVGSAWTYTVGMLSSIGQIFGSSQQEQNRPSTYNYDDVMDDEQYAIRTDYDGASRRSSISNGVYGYTDNHQHHHQQQQSHHRSLSRRSHQHHNQHHNHQQRHSRHISSSSSMGASKHKLNHYQRQASMAGSYADNEIHHNRGLSAAAIRAKRNKSNQYHMNSNNNDQHQRKPSRHRTFSNMSSQSISNNDYRHRSKQPSKQEILLESTDNENIRDSMAKIFDAFEQAEDNVHRQSQDIDISSGIVSNGLDMFSIDDMMHDNDNEIDIGMDIDNGGVNHHHQQQQQQQHQKHHKRQSSTYHSDYMRKPIAEEEDDEDMNGNHDDNDNVDDKIYSSFQNMDEFWNTNMNQDDHDNVHGDDDGVVDDDDNVNNQYSDDDRFGIAAMDFSGGAALQSL